MIPTNQGDLGPSEIRQGPQGISQPWGQTDTGVYQITQHKNPMGLLPAMTKLQQRIQSATVGIARDWNAMGLKGFCLAKVQVGKQQLVPEDARWPVAAGTQAPLSATARPVLPSTGLGSRIQR